MDPLAASFLDNLFVGQLVENPVYFFSVVLTVVVSVTLHELGHAYAAIAQGDETPRIQGHLTLDPMKHMGPMSLLVLLLVGIAWGATPVNPSRFRSRHGDALVSLAGPAVNLVLAVLGLTVLGLWMRASPQVSGTFAANLRVFLFVFGTWNVLLCLFNLLPIPPLDGSSVVASFVPAARRLMADPNNQGVFFALFIAVFFAAPHLWRAADVAASTFGGWVGGMEPGTFFRMALRGA